MPPLILLSGMGADDRVFAMQLAAFGQAVCPAWIAPLKDESLANYARRFAVELRKTIGNERCFLGGASFGGFVAGEMARHLSPLGVILVGSVASPGELPPKIKAMRKLAKLSSALPFAVVRPLCRIILNAPDSSVRPATKHLIQQAADADAEFLRWACGAVLRWEENHKPLACPVYHVHWTADRILPIRYTHPTHVLRGAGHVLSLTHGAELNGIIRDMMRTN